MSYMGPICHTFASLFKYYFLIQKATSMTVCIIRMEKDWEAVDNANDRDIMLKQAKMGRNLIKVCAIFAYVGGILYMTVWNLLQKNKFSGSNVTTRTLSYPGYDRFVNTQLSPTFEIIQTLQYISGLLKYTITTASYSLVVICVTHIRGQIQIQMSHLENLVEETKQNSTDNTYFANIIERHAEILSFCRIIEEGLNMLCLMQIVDSTLLICFLANHCLLVGQIGQASYEIDWYTLPPKKASFVVLMNVVSLQPPKLTGGKIFELSILTFGAVMKTSVVYLNLLRTFN
ncbi:uncharacterized protein LOC143341376 [Colletes latitarsis]|uniref:uncharacterized protein LOC143341376 n=1 Tax=Colletes latitarsis TaxID=2605962 RepID=UPI004036D771